MDEYAASDDERERYTKQADRLATCERQLRLLGLLSTNTCTRREVFEHLGDYYRISSSHDSSQIPKATERLFERDIQFLKNVGFDVQKIAGGRHPMRYRLASGAGPFTHLLFSDQEVETLALLATMFTDPTRYARHDPQQLLPPSPLPPFADEILRCIERLADMLSPAQRQRFNRWARQPFLYLNITPVTDYRPYREIIAVLVKAISDRQQIRFIYTAAQQQKSRLHEPVDPYYIVQLEGHFYLIAYNHEWNRSYEYRLDRIQQDSLQELSNMIDVERRRRPVEFRFWLDSSLAKNGLSQRWLSQTIEREEPYIDDQGQTRQRMLIRATAYNEWRVTQQMLRYGSKVEVVEPPSLRQQMREEITRMAHMYEDNRK